MELPVRDFISHYQSRSETRLNRLLSQLDNKGTTLIEAMRYSVLGGGKRMRPLLAYAAAGAVGKINETTDDFASALECMHVYSLIHDDLPAMDDDALRRGKPTCHIAFDEATAILAGDALHTLAIETIATSSHVPPDAKLAAIQELARSAGASGMVLGQSIDLESMDRALTIEQLEVMHVHKTGALIEASVVLGAISANASKNQIESLRQYAKAIGLAFQVQDDIIDVTSDTQTLGKTQGADQRLNKPTYVSLMGLKDAQSKAASLKDEAIQSLSVFAGKAKTLIDLAEYIVNRTH